MGGKFHWFKSTYNDEKENSEFKPVKLRLKIDLVSYPARAEGLVNSTYNDVIFGVDNLFDQWDPNTATPMEEMSGLRGGLK